MKALNKKIDEAIATRMEPKGYGDNPDRLVEKKHDHIFVTPKELDKIIRMRRCISVGMLIHTDCYTQELIDNGEVYKDLYSNCLTITKKIAKDFVKELISQSEKRYMMSEKKMVKISLHGHPWKNNGSKSFAVYIG